MSRKPLDPTTKGKTGKMEVRVQQTLLSRADAVLRDGEKRSEFVREAMERECKRRERKKP